MIALDFGSETQYMKVNKLCMFVDASGNIRISISITNSNYRKRINIHNEIGKFCWWVGNRCKFCQIIESFLNLT